MAAFYFKFYPGDYLRDTQNLSEKAQGAYDRIMCEHMRNMCITYDQHKFFTKRLSDDEKEELSMVLTDTGAGYMISWVSESVAKSYAYSGSRSKNRLSETPQSYDEHMKTYDRHMESNSNSNSNSSIKNKKGNEKKELNYSFDHFWNLYDKKVGDRAKISKKWEQ